jgi:hypothetical protein
MGAFSELDMERSNFYSEEAAPAGFSLEDEAITLESQASHRQELTAGQSAAVDDTPNAATNAAGNEDSETGTKDEPDKKVEAAEDDDAKRKAHEEAEAKRKAEFDAKQAAKNAAVQEQLDKLAAMSDEEVLAASMQRVSEDTEKLTRRNMKECVAEHIQTKCLEDPAFARLTMHPKKSMIHCFQYISRKAWDYVQDELKANNIQPGPGRQGYGCDVPDDLCYQWAEDYFHDPDAKEDHEDEEKFVPKPYTGGTSKSKTTGKKEKGKKKTDKKPPETPKNEPDPKPKDNGGQMSLLDAA